MLGGIMAALPRMIPQESYWTYKSAGTPADPPPTITATEQEWSSASPGMRRAIWQDYLRISADMASTVQDIKSAPKGGPPETLDEAVCRRDMERLGKLYDTMAA